MNLAQVMQTNPFRRSIVPSAWAEPDGDVAAIHRDVFEECCRALDEVIRCGTSLGIVIHGQAGAGKTHLLARLRRHLFERLPEPPAVGRPVFAWLKLDADPSHLWRHVRRHLVRDLCRSGPPLPGWSEPVSQLELLLLVRIAELRAADLDLELWWQWLRTDAPQELSESVTALGRSLQWPFSLTRAVGQYLCGDRDAAESWLRGDVLPESVVDQLGLAHAPEDDGGGGEETARDVTLGLLRLATAASPAVICFDQVEAVVRNPKDNTALFAFGRLIATLHDETNYCLLVTCVQSAFLDRQLEQIRGADRDRMASYGRRALLPVGWPEAEELVRLRLRQGLPPELFRDAGVWPLDEQQLRQFVEERAPTPRELLRWCAVQFAERAGRELKQVATEVALEEEFYRLLAHRVAVPVSEAPAVCAHGLALLLYALDSSWLHAEPPTSDVDLCLSYGGKRVCVVYVGEPSMRRLVHRFRRLCEWFRHERATSLVLLCDPRTPLSATARRTVEYFEELRRLGAHVAEIDSDALAALNAVRQLLSAAKSGDLAPEGVTIAEQQVRDWLRERLPRELASIVFWLTKAVSASRNTDESL